MYDSREIYYSIMFVALTQAEEMHTASGIDIKIMELEADYEADSLVMAKHRHAY